MNKKKLLSLLAVGAMGFSSLQAETIFSDNFESIDVDATDNTADGDGVSGTAGWVVDFSSGSTPSVSAVTDANFAGGAGNQALQMDTGGNTFYGTHASFAPVTLGIGDVLTLTADVRYTSSPGNTGTAFRFGAFDSNVDGSAYWVKASTDTGAGSAASIIQDGQGQTFGFQTGGTWNFESLASTAGGEVMDDTSVHSFSLTISRLSATQVRLQSSIDGSFGLDITDDSAAGNNTIFTSFDSIGFRNGGINTDFNVDNVVVDFTAVPEPSSIALMGLALVGALVGLRRRK